MKKFLFLAAILCEICLAQNQTILVMKTSAKPDLDNQAIIIPTVIEAKLERYQSYRVVVWDEIESKLGKSRMADINRSHDSATIVNFTAIVERNGLHPNYMLFSSLSKYDSDYTINIEIADAQNGSIIGMVSTSVSSIESFHTSGIVDNVMRKINAHIPNTQNAQSVATSRFPGINALGKDSSYLSILKGNIAEIKSYINFFNFHDNRKNLVINYLTSQDTSLYPSINIIMNTQADISKSKSLLTICFVDSLSKNKTDALYSANFYRGNGSTITKVVLKSDVPAQSRFASEYFDMKTSMIDKLSKTDFVLAKADSNSGLYGVKYNYYYALKPQNRINMQFTADASAFSVTITQPEKKQ